MCKTNLELLKVVELLRAQLLALLQEGGLRLSPDLGGELGCLGVREPTNGVGRFL